MLAAPPLPLLCSREDLEFAVNEVMTAQQGVLFPFASGSGLSAAERLVLLEGGADLEVHAYGEEDPVTRTAASHAAILASALSTAEVAQRLGVSEMRIRQRLSGRSLQGIHTSRGWRIPSFQFSADGELPGWDRVSKAIPEDVSPVELLLWLDLAHPDLHAGKNALSPRQWLASGRDPGAVVACVGDFETW